MEYPNIVEGMFLSRPNRFIAQVEIGGREETCHVKNTGRCRELLVPGCRVYLVHSDNPARKTRYDLVAVQKGLAADQHGLPGPQQGGTGMAGGRRSPGVTLVRPETTYDQSRFDFYFEQGRRKAFMEVKGVTLEEKGVVRFPDAPTARGSKHLHELVKAHQEGYDVYLFLVIQMADVDHFEPNWRTDPGFWPGFAGSGGRMATDLVLRLRRNTTNVKIGKK